MLIRGGPGYQITIHEYKGSLVKSFKRNSSITYKILNIYYVTVLLELWSVTIICCIVIVVIITITILSIVIGKRFLWQCHFQQMPCGGKFGKLLPVRTSRHLYPNVRRKVYTACARSAMLHGCQTCGQNSSDLERIHRHDRTKIRWSCVIKDQDETPSASQLKKLAIRILRQSFVVGDWDGMAMCNVPRPV